MGANGGKQGGEFDMKKSRKIRSWITGTVLLATLLNFGVASLRAQNALVLKVRHDHGWGSCSGTLTLDARGVRYETTHTKDARNWTYEEVQEFQVEEGQRLKVITYEDRKWRLGADKVFEFTWTAGEPTPLEVYDFLRARTRRPIAAGLRIADLGEVRYEFPVKHLGVLKGRQGRLLFTERWVVLQSDEKGGNRTWRYEDLESVSSSGLYDLTLTTHEQQKLHYASRRVYQFQLKEALPPGRYDRLWRFVNGKKGVDLFGAGGSSPQAP